MTNRTLSIHDSLTGKTLDCDVYDASQGSPAFDVSKIHNTFGAYTYDPGYGSTSSCRSAITFIDGDKGELQHRGYSIEDLSAHSSYMEVCYLLLEGELPTAEQLSDFEAMISQHTMVHEDIRKFIEGFRYDAHPMAMLSATVAAMASFYHDLTDVTDPEHRKITAYRLIGKMPTIAALCYKHHRGQPAMPPRNNCGYVENFLQMMFGVPTQDYIVSPISVKALETLMILHADHEQNASTSTVRLAGSSGANPFASIAAGIASLWGPAHGGANEAVMNMLDAILESGESIESTIARAKDKSDPFRLMGFGHRVYKNFDPRARCIEKICHDLLDELGGDQPMFKLARDLEQATLADPYFQERKLYPNVDFYSGIILRALNIPMNMFTVMFAMSRTVGWVAQWNEMHEDPESRIGRPRQLYVGEKLRPYPTK